MAGSREEGPARQGARDATGPTKGRVKRGKRAGMSDERSGEETAKGTSRDRAASSRHSSPRSPSLCRLAGFGLSTFILSIRAAGPVRPWNGPSGRTEPVRLRGEWMNEVKERRE